MTKRRITIYTLALALMLFAACKSKIDQGEVQHVFKRSPSGDVTDDETAHDILLPGVSALDNPKANKIEDPSPTPTTKTALHGSNSMLQRHWNNDNRHLVAVIGMQSPAPSVNKATAKPTSDSNSKSGYIYYKVWQPIFESNKKSYPGLLDDYWQQGVLHSTDKNSLDYDNSTKHKLHDTLVIAGTLRYMKAPGPGTVRIKARLSDDLNHGWWSWTGTRESKNKEDRGTITWTDGPAN